MTIGFIGQGFIGKNYADDFEKRGYAVVRYAKEEPYINNGEAIALCDVVFIAVPTPTTPHGFDSSILQSVISFVGKGKIAVVKSTTLPGTIKKLQAMFPDKIILQSPEFLTEKTAAYDAAHPNRNIIGKSLDTKEQQEAAELVLSILPPAPYTLIADSNETELIKYAGNAFLFIKILYGNLFYDLSQSLGGNYDVVREAIAADPRIGPSHLNVIDQSGHMGALIGRGAGGHCFIKDFAALRLLYSELLPTDTQGIAILNSLEGKNKELLLSSKKDIDLLAEVYGGA